jgi:hypothetical protein
MVKWMFENGIVPPDDSVIATIRSSAQSSRYSKIVKFIDEYKIQIWNFVPRDVQSAILNYLTFKERTLWLFVSKDMSSLVSSNLVCNFTKSNYNSQNCTSTLLVTIYYKWVIILFLGIFFVLLNFQSEISL